MVPKFCHKLTGQQYCSRGHVELTVIRDCQFRLKVLQSIHQGQRHAASPSNGWAPVVAAART